MDHLWSLLPLLPDAAAAYDARRATWPPPPATTQGGPARPVAARSHANDDGGPGEGPGLAEPRGFWKYAEGMDVRRTYDFMGDNARRFMGLPLANPDSSAASPPALSTA